MFRKAVKDLLLCQHMLQIIVKTDASLTVCMKQSENMSLVHWKCDCFRLLTCRGIWQWVNVQNLKGHCGGKGSWSANVWLRNSFQVGRKHFKSLFFFFFFTELIILITPVSVWKPVCVYFQVGRQDHSLPSRCGPLWGDPGVLLTESAGYVPHETVCGHRLGCPTFSQRYRRRPHAHTHTHTDVATDYQHFDCPCSSAGHEPWERPGADSHSVYNICQTRFWRVLFACKYYCFHWCACFPVLFLFQSLLKFWRHLFFFQTKKYVDVIIPRGVDNMGKCKNKGCFFRG